jgi:hypothetical protein
MKRAWKMTAVLGLAMTALGGPVSTASAITGAPRPLAVQRYERELERDCQHGVVPGPSAYRLYREARRAAGSGQGSIKSPDAAFEQCEQAE